MFITAQGLYTQNKKNTTGNFASYSSHEPDGLVIVSGHVSSHLRENPLVITVTTGYIIARRLLSFHYEFSQ